MKIRNPRILACILLILIAGILVNAESDTIAYSTKTGRKESPKLVPQDQLCRVNAENLFTYKDADIATMLQALVVKYVDGNRVHVLIENPLG